MKKSIAASLSTTALALGAACVVFMCASVTVLASTNTPPTIDPITNQTAYVDHPTLFSLNVADAETATMNLQLTVATSNPTLITPEDFVTHYYIGDNGNWFLTLVPTSGLTGIATNTVTVSDGTNTISASFVLTITPPPARTARFANPAPLIIPDSGPASLYPSTITVTGMVGTITYMDLTISKFAHHFPDDVHMMVVGPTGQPVVFWSKCGGGTPLTNVTVTIVDGAPMIPDSFETWSEQLGPADYAANNPPDNNTNDFPFPAPGAPYTNAVALATYYGLPANGTWSLYVYDDYPPDHGMIAGGWSLMITTTGGQALTVNGITAGNKVYDGTNSATINTAGATLVGVASGDIVSLVTTGASGTFSDKNVGTNKTIQLAGLTITGPNATNYTLLQPTTTANITPATLTVKADDKARAYGTTNPVFTASYTGFTNGENLATSGVTGTPTLATAATSTSPVTNSPYAITTAIGSLLANNYTFSFLSGQLTVAPTTASVAVVSSINPACFGVPVNFTATVTPSGAGTPTGTVQFKIDGGIFGSPVVLSGNSATSGTTSTLTAGSHTVTAIYSGDSNFNGTTSPASPATLTVIAAPTTFNVTGGGAYCTGGGGVPVGLDGSQTNVSYQLLLGGNPIGAPVAGTGNALPFGSRTATGGYSVTASNVTTGCTASMNGTATVTINPTPSCSVSPTNAAICAGGSRTFTVTPSGGAPGYTFLWNTGATTSNITASTAGTYSVTVTDSNGCTTSCSATLTVNPTPSCSVTPTNAAICAGGSRTFTVNPSGGAPGYTFLWNTGATTSNITASTAGTYSVTVTDSNGCTSSCSATLTVNPTPSCAVVPSSAAICAGGSRIFTVTPSGGAPGYTFLWNTGATTSNITASTAGTYSVTVTDSNGCTTSCSAILTVNPTPSCAVVPSSAAICAGGSQMFTVNPSAGTSPYTYLWSDGTVGVSLTTNIAGTYSVTVTDSNGCTTSCSATLTVNPLPTVFNVTGGGAYCTVGVAIGLDGSQSGVSYQLLSGSNPIGAPVAGTGNLITFGNQAGAGTYTVTASNVTTGCTFPMSGSATVTLTASFACWQLQYFGCTNCPQASASADPDGDGQNNLSEFLAGTDPTNNVSALRITLITSQGNNILVTWTTAGSHTNAVQAVNGNPGYNTNFVDISSPFIITGSGDTSTNYVDVGGATNAPARFYRVRLVP